MARFFSCFLSSESAFLLLKPGRVVSFVRDAGTAVEFENPAGDIVEKIAIMGNGDNSARLLIEEALQPGD